MAYVDLSGCSLKTDKDIYEVGETVTILINISRNMPEVASYSLLIGKWDLPPSVIDLGDLSSGSHIKQITAEPPTGKIFVQLRVKTISDLRIIEQTGNPTISFEVIEKSPLYMVLLMAILVIIIISVITVYRRRKKLSDARKRKIGHK